MPFPFSPLHRVIASTLGLALTPLAATAAVDFERDVLPIFQRSCFITSAVASSILLPIAVFSAPKPSHSRNATPPQVTRASSHGEDINSALPPNTPAQISSRSLTAQRSAIIRWYWRRMP